MLPRMRTAAQLAAEYKKKDSGTAVTVYFLRQLIRDGKVPFVKAGKKFLINADAVDAFLAVGQQSHENASGCGTIRPIRA